MTHDPSSDILHLGAARLGVLIDHGRAVLAMDDGEGCHSVACAVDREQLLAVAGMLSEAAEKMRAETTTPR